MNNIKSIFKHITFCIAVLAINSVFQQAAAQIKLPAIIGDNMVMQQKMNVPIWGWANPGELVIVTFRNKEFKTKAAADGKWALKLDRYEPGGPFELSIAAGQHDLKIKNILIGEVWLASGQSNMEFGLQTERDGKQAVSQANDNQIHFFYVPMTSSLFPAEDITKPGKADSPNGRWVVCSVELMSNPQFAWHGFSAIGYYFAKEIRSLTKAPVGMIGSYKGGTPAQAWISSETLSGNPMFERYIARRESLRSKYDEATKEYPAKLAVYNQQNKDWEKQYGGQPTPEKPRPKALESPDGGFSAPSNLYNAMIKPIIPYGLKGVIWYQGESNGDNLRDAVEYKTLFPLLINDWRKNWPQQQLPFLFVQLANFKKPAVTASEGNWAWVREAQYKTLSLPQTGMAVITDIGEENDIHPKNKLDVALRLAAAAKYTVYKQKLVYTGPVFDHLKVEGNKIRLFFKETGSGILAGNGVNATVLKGFGIAGSDKKFVWAKAVIDGNTIVVSADGVNEPTAVRYNWADNPQGNLYNKEGFPAASFRTDDWPPMK